MTGPRIGSLFSGYGGLDQGIQQAMGGTVAWVADIDPGPRKILAHRYPHAPNLGDVTAVDWATVAPVDVICGGSPCQDLSTAGRRAGMRPGTRSGLWESMREAIAIIRPEWVVWENVRGSLSAEAHSDMVDDEGCMGGGAGQPVLRALGRVLGDLADLGFDAEWRGLRAADVGAPHGRYRIFVVARRQGAANTHNAGLEGHQGPQGAAQAGRHGHSQPGAGGPAVTLLPTPTATPYGNNQSVSSGAAVRPSLDKLVTLLPTPTSNLGENGGPQDPAKRRAGGHSVSIEDAVHGLTLLPTPRATDGTKGGPNRAGSSGDLMLPSAVVQLLPTPTGSDANSSGAYGYGGQQFCTLTDATVRLPGRFGDYQAAIDRWEAITRPAPPPTEPGRNSPRLSPRFTEWLMGLPGGWITDVPGITRNEALRACGNGVVPQQAAAAIADMAGVFLAESGERAA